VWIERNCDLPWSKFGLDFPVINFENQHLWIKLLWNGCLFLLFGFLHSAFAQPEVHKLLNKVFPEEFLRSIFMVVTGLALILMMTCWQNTGIELYSLPLSQRNLDILSVSLYVLLMSGNAIPLTKFGFFPFIGIKQIFEKKTGEKKRSEGTEKLITEGLYGIVRHPIYTFTLSAIALAPQMTLDRFWIFILSVVYLLFGVPVEEKKLVKEFGKPYLEYKTQVPAVIPKLSLNKEKKFE